MYICMYECIQIYAYIYMSKHVHVLVYVCVACGKDMYFAVVSLLLIHSIFPTCLGSSLLVQA